MSALILPAPAKLNLFLNITGRRADGYHELQTLFQLLDYGDTLEFSPRDDGLLTLSPALPGVAAEDNLVLRAARALQARSAPGCGADITLHKRLPMGGGIGGGSSDAATALLGLNHLWKTGLDLEQLAAIGLTLGADVPVFVHGRTAWAEGVGEQLQPVSTDECWYLVAIPPCSVSTAEIFSHRELTRHNSPIKIAAFLEGGAGNTCEPVVRKLYPEVDSALNWLSQFAPAQLTGTGCCLFAKFADEASARDALEQRPSQLQGFIARGVNHSPLHKALNLM